MAMDGEVLRKTVRLPIWTRECLDKEAENGGYSVSAQAHLIYDAFRQSPWELPLEMPTRAPFSFIGVRLSRRLYGEIERLARRFKRSPHWVLAAILFSYFEQSEQSNTKEA